MDVFAIAADWLVNNGYLSLETANKILYYLYSVAHFFTDLLTSLINQIITLIKNFH